MNAFPCAQTRLAPRSMVAMAVMMAILTAVLTTSALLGATARAEPANDTFYVLLESRLADTLDDRTPTVTPLDRLPNHRRWKPLSVDLPGGGTLTLELPEYINAFGEHIGYATDKAFLSGRKAIAARYQPEATPTWRANGDGWTLDVNCMPETRLRYAVTVGPGRVDVVSTIENHTGGTLEHPFQVLCTSFSKDSPFQSIDPLTTHFLHHGKTISWPAVTNLDRIWRADSPTNEGVYWLECPVRGSGRKLNPFHRRAVMTGEADAGVIVQDHGTDPSTKLVLVTQPGGSVFKNCRGGCLHANPMHRAIPDGETGQVRFSILQCRTDSLAEILEECWQEAAEH